MLNGMDGREVFKQLKSSPETDKIPVIMASARYKESYISSQKHNPDDYLEKPFNMTEMLQKVNRLTENQKNTYEIKIINADCDTINIPIVKC